MRDPGTDTVPGFGVENYWPWHQLLRAALRALCTRTTRISYQAAARIGAVKEGVLRHHRLTWDGKYRDTLYYSVLQPEWAGVKERLQTFLSRGSIVGR